MQEYELAKEYVNGVCTFQLVRLGIFGPNGCGKSRLVKDVASYRRIPLNLPGGIVFINGHKTTPALKDDLAFYNESTPEGSRTIIVLNDCTLLHSRNSVDQGFLKALLETESSGIASYSTSKGRVDVDISKLSFIFTGNETSTVRSPHLKAIFDRIHTVKLVPTLAEKINLTMKLMIINEPDLNKRMIRMKILEQIIKRIAVSGCTNYSLRTFAKLEEIYNFNSSLLHNSILMEFKDSLKLQTFIEVQNAHSSNNTDENTKIIEFEKKTGLKRRSYFYQKKKYQEWLDSFDEFQRWIDGLDNNLSPLKPL